MSVTYIADYLRAKDKTFDEVFDGLCKSDLYLALDENRRCERIIDDLNRMLETGVFKDMGLDKDK